MRMRLVAALFAVVSGTLLAACNNDDLTVIKDPGRAPLPPPVTADATDSTSRNDNFPAPTSEEGIDKVLVTIIENKGLTQMKQHAANLWTLAQKYGYASDYRAITHPSLPNYIAIAAGDRLGVSDDGDPAKHKLTDPNIFTNTLKAGGTAQTFADNMGSETCRQTNQGKYAVRHNPWTYFSNDRDNCQKFVVDGAAYEETVAAGNLANLTFLIPDNCHNAHDCSIETADKWVFQKVVTAMSGPDFRAGRLLIVITADEDNKKEGNRILTVLVHPSLSHKVVGTRLTHYSLNRLLAQITHTSPLQNGASAPDMATAFGLDIKPEATAQ